MMSKHAITTGNLVRISGEECWYLSSGPLCDVVAVDEDALLRRPEEAHVVAATAKRCMHMYEVCSEGGSFVCYECGDLALVTSEPDEGFVRILYKSATFWLETDYVYFGELLSRTW